MLTRAVSGLWGGRRAGSFASKAEHIVTHPVGILTRPVSGLWGGKRTGSFAGKGGIIVEPLALILRSRFTTAVYLRSHSTVSFDMASLPTDRVNIKSKIK